MKTETLLLLAVAGVAAYYFWKQTQGSSSASTSAPLALQLQNPVVRQYDTIASIYQRIQNAVGGSGSIALTADQWGQYVAQFSSALSPGMLGFSSTERIELNDYWAKAAPALQAMGLSGFGGGWVS